MDKDADEGENPIIFDPSKIKVLRLFYGNGEKLSLNLSKFKVLYELSIQAVKASAKFNTTLADELKACDKLKKLTLDINTLHPNSISSVLGYISTLESLSLRLEDDFDFESIDYNLPKLKELNLYG